MIYIRTDGNIIATFSVMYAFLNILGWIRVGLVGQSPASIKPGYDRKLKTFTYLAFYSLLKTLKTDKRRKFISFRLPTTFLGFELFLYVESLYREEVLSYKY